MECKEPILDLKIIEDFKSKHEKDYDVPFEVGIAMYTDGGAKDGQASYGVHGFIYCNTEPKRGVVTKGYVTTNLGYVLQERLIHTFECFKPLDEKPTLVQEPLGAIVTPMFYFNLCGSILDATNNVGETIALQTGLKFVEQIQELYPLKEVHIRSDSKYALYGCRDHREMIKRGWRRKDGQTIANLELWQQTVAILEKVNEQRVESLVMEWVHGHVDWLGNIQADALASKALVAAISRHVFDSVSVVPSNGYWSVGKTIKVPYLLTDSKWYTRVNDDLGKTDDDKTIFFTGAHKEDKRVGQLLSNFYQSVAFIGEVPEHLETLRKQTALFDNVDSGMDIPGIYFTNINLLYKPDVIEVLTAQEGIFVKRNEHLKQLQTPNNVELMLRLVMDGKLNEHFKNYDVLATLLNDVRKGGELAKGLIMNDVTDVFFKEVENKKGKMENKVTLTNETDLKIPVKVDTLVKDQEGNYVNMERESKVTLTFGVTAPIRRVFNGIKDDQPKVYILTQFEPFVQFRYYLIIVLENGDCGLWTNIASNAVNLY